MKAKFYIWEHCGNLVTTIHNAGVPLVCCGEKMKELLPNTVGKPAAKSICRWQSFPAAPRLRWVQWSIPWWMCTTSSGSLWRRKTADSSATSPPGRHPRRYFELGSEKPVAVYAYSQPAWSVDDEAVRNKTGSCQWLNACRSLFCVCRTLFRGKEA